MLLTESVRRSQSTARHGDQEQEQEKTFHGSFDAYLRHCSIDINHNHCQIASAKHMEAQVRHDKPLA